LSELLLCLLLLLCIAMIQYAPRPLLLTYHLLESLFLVVLVLARHLAGPILHVHLIQLLQPMLPQLLSHLMPLPQCSQVALHHGVCCCLLGCPA
jgi:hypothetical protein